MECMVISRQEKRKGERKNKKAGGENHSLVQQQKSKKNKNFESKNQNDSLSENSSLIQNPLPEFESKTLQQSKKNEYRPKSSKLVQQKKGLTGRFRKTKFERYLEMVMRNHLFSAEKDLEMEKKLAKKLKVKDGKLNGENDGIDVLLGDATFLDLFSEENPFELELPYDLDVNNFTYKDKRQKSSSQGLDEESDSKNAASESVETRDAAIALEEAVEVPVVKATKIASSKQGKGGNGVGRAPGTSKSVEVASTEVAVEKFPVKVSALEESERYVSSHMRSHRGSESENYSLVRRRIRGLLNRLSGSNVKAVTNEILSYVSSDATAASQIIIKEVLTSCSTGHRGNEQYAGVFAAFVAGMAHYTGIDFGAKLIASLAKTFEDKYIQEDNLSVRNLTLLLSYLCIYGVCSSDLIYDFLTVLSGRLKEIDVSTILTILQCCGMKIRSDDPTAMKNFIFNIQSRVNELKSSSGDGQETVNNKRMGFMLETICEIKNNKKRPREDTAHDVQVKKWLQELKVGDLSIRGLKWHKLVELDEQWLPSGDVVATQGNAGAFASTMDKEIGEAQKMLHLAAAQRMNTDARKAIFCIIMSGEDYVDAFEKLLRLDLPGKQDRELMRVLVECCLQEKVFNKYYTILASKLCEHDKMHKFTLKFCIWDHFKEIERMELIRSMNLAKFVAEMVASFTLSLAVLKTAGLSDVKLLTAKRIMHFRILFEAILERPEQLVWNVFSRVAGDPKCEILRNSMEFFISENVVKRDRNLSGKFRILKKALNNVEGVVVM